MPTDTARQVVRRYLESLVFEVAYKRSAKDTRIRAEGFAGRGVERQIAIFPNKPRPQPQG